MLAAASLFAGTVDSRAASVSKSIDIKAPADKVWAMIGPFCSIKDWHPAIGQCMESGNVRTLTTKDGKAQFIEKKTASAGMSYSHAIEKSPLPISNYVSTLKVMPRGKDGSTAVWSSTYTPNAEHEPAAATAISGIYQAGLDNIQKFAEQ